MTKDRDINANGKDGKRKDILNAAMVEFCNGYAKASTDSIVKLSGVSKGLLFHHFGSKKDLFLCTYEYALQIAVSEFYELINFEQRDILERWRQIALLKMDLMKKHPMIFTFIAHASFPDSDEVKEKIAEQRTKFTGDAFPKLFSNIDYSFFREDIDVDIAIRIILNTMESYSQTEADSNKSTEDYYGEYDRYLNDLERYIQFFRQCFYKS